MKIVATLLSDMQMK